MCQFMNSEGNINEYLQTHFSHFHVHDYIYINVKTIIFIYCYFTTIIIIEIWKESMNSDGQQIPSISTKMNNYLSPSHWIQKKNMTHDFSK
jgi:hypothetical protein